MAEREWFKAGDVIHGFAGGSFGRDSYACRRVEYVGSDYIVTRNERGEVEMAAAEYVPTHRAAADRSYCSSRCSGPDFGPPDHCPDAEDREDQG